MKNLTFDYFSNGSSTNIYTVGTTTSTNTITVSNGGIIAVTGTASTGTGSITQATIDSPIVNSTNLTMEATTGGVSSAGSVLNIGQSSGDGVNTNLTGNLQIGDGANSFIVILASTTATLGTAAITIEQDASLRTSGTSYANNLTLMGGQGDGTRGLLSLSSGTTLTGTITLNGIGAGGATSYLDVYGGSHVKISGNIGEMGGSQGIELQNPNTNAFYLYGTNSYSGGTIIDSNTGGANFIVGINSDRSFGAVPSSAGTNITITGTNSTATATIEDDAASIVLNANRNIAVNTVGELFLDTSGPTATYTATGTGTASNTLEIDGIISGSVPIVKVGTGTLTLVGANTYTGFSAVQNGSVNVTTINSASGGAASSNLGAPTTVATGTLLLGSSTTSGTLVDTGTGETTDRVVALAGTTGGGTLDQSGTGKLKFTSGVTSLVSTGSSKTLTLQGSTAGTGEISGAIADAASSTTGTLGAAGTNAATTLTVNNAPELFTVGTTVTGSASIQSGTTVTAIVGNTVTLSKALTGAITNGTALTFTGVASTTGVTKTGSGTWTLSGTNTYTGATAVNQGVLDVTGSLVAGAGTTVGSGATLEGTGTLSGTVGVSSGGFLAPGTGGSGSTGTLNVGATSITSATLTYALNSNASTADLLAVTGNLTLSSATLSTSDLGTAVLPNGTMFTVASYTGTLSGTLTGLANGSSIAIGNNTYQINYGSLSNSDITLTDVDAVPEPGTWALFLVGISLMGACQLRRSRQSVA